MKQPHCNLLGIGVLESVIFYPLSSTRTIVFEFDEEFSSEMRALSLSPRAKKFFAINARKKKKEKIPSPFFFSLPAFTEKKNSQSSRGEEISVKITEGKSGDERSERFVVEEKA